MNEYYIVARGWKTGKTSNVKEKEEALPMEKTGSQDSPEWRFKIPNAGNSSIITLILLV